MTHDCKFCYERLVGDSDWAADKIFVYVDDKALEDQSACDRLHQVVADHLTILYRHLFLSCKPSKPAQSRWTGVASVAQFALSLSLCLGVLKPLFKCLAAKDADTANSAATDKDADAWA